MRLAKKLLAPALAAVLALSPVLPAYAASVRPPKEEVVYINLTSAGDVDTVEVVNILDLTAPGTVTDYGDYASVRNMTTTDPVTLAGGTVTIDAAQAGRLYYEGSLPGAEIPWRIALDYALDGTARTADEIAGASGALTIHLTVKENPRCPGDFFDTYALQISLTLDGDKCRDIVADGATAANVGSDKQLNYTVLPGRGADITVQAQVTDFAMDAIAINGIPLSLDVQVDDQALLAQVTDLTDAIAQLDEGAGALSDGAAELTTGADEAAAGASALYEGASSLYSGAGSLQSGGASVQSGAWSVSSGASQVSDGAQALKGGLDTLGAGLATLDANSAALSQGSADVLTNLQTLQASLENGNISDDDIANMQATLAGLSGQVDSLSTTLSGMGGLSDTLTGIYSSLSSVLISLSGTITDMGDDPYKDEVEAAYNTLYSATESYASAMLNLVMTVGSLNVENLKTQLGYAAGYLDQLSGLTDSLGQLKAGVDALVDGYTTLNDGIQTYTAGVTAAYAGYGQLAPGAASLADGAASLASGAGTLASGASTLAGGISDVYAASGALAEGAGALDTGVGALAEGAAALGEGAGQVKEGTAALAEGTDGMDGAIQDQIDGLLESVTGGSGEPASFVSAKNTNVRAVQFVIRTPAIQSPAPEAPAPEPAAETTFWEKLIALF